MKEFNEPRYLSREKFYNKDYEDLIAVFNNISKDKYDYGLRTLLNKRNFYLIKKIFNSLDLTEDNYRKAFVHCCSKNFKVTILDFLLINIKELNIIEITEVFEWCMNFNNEELLIKIIKDKKINFNVKKASQEKQVVAWIELVLYYQPSDNFFNILLSNEDIKNIIINNIENIRAPNKNILNLIKLEDTKNKINNF